MIVPFEEDNGSEDDAPFPGYPSDGEAGPGNLDPPIQPMDQEDQKQDEEFQFPFQVATIKDGFNQRGYLDKDGGQLEWLWGRAHEYCAIGTPAHKLLPHNTESILKEFDVYQFTKCLALSFTIEQKLSSRIGLRMDCGRNTL